MCPLCRAKLPDVPSTTPRSIQSFPFIPNRACKATASRLLSILAEALRHAGIGEYSTGTLPDGGEWHGTIDDRIAAWGESGTALLEWKKRARRAALRAVGCPHTMLTNGY